MADSKDTNKAIGIRKCMAFANNMIKKYYQYIIVHHDLTRGHSTVAEGTKNLYIRASFDLALLMDKTLTL